nr:protein sidekick-like isoform X1 [Cherax quadricarinatus]
MCVTTTMTAAMTATITAAPTIAAILTALLLCLSTTKGQESEEGERHEITWGRPNTNTAYFDDDTPTNVTAVVGQKATLPCQVINLDKKDVSWIRQRDLHILTVGIFTYTSDDRFKVYHPEDSNEWYLEISPVTFRDAGVYECQVSTSPKVFLPILLTVEVQQARIQGPKEVYIQSGSTIKLTCIVNTHSENVGAVTWFRDTNELDYDSPRRRVGRRAHSGIIVCVQQCAGGHRLPASATSTWASTKLTPPTRMWNVLHAGGTLMYEAPSLTQDRSDVDIAAEGLGGHVWPPVPLTEAMCGHQCHSHRSDV